MVINQTEAGYVATVDGKLFPAAHTRKAAEAASALYLRLKEVALNAKGGQTPSPFLSTLILDELITLLKD